MATQNSATHKKSGSTAMEDHHKVNHLKFCKPTKNNSSWPNITARVWVINIVQGHQKTQVGQLNTHLSTRASANPLKKNQIRQLKLEVERTISKKKNNNSGYSETTKKFKWVDKTYI